VSRQPSRLPHIFSASQGKLILAGILVLVANGLAFGGGYGESIDEPPHARYGRQILQIYQGQRAIGDTIVNPLEHGPFYSFVSYVVGGWVEAIRSGWTPTDGRHFVYYLSFVLATISVGWLVGRYTRPIVAWVVAGLFFTQPLLYGHAFINPKDIPFMAFFVGALAAGVMALNPPASHGASSAAPANPPPAGAQSDSARKGKWLAALSLVSLGGLAILWFWNGLLPFLSTLLQQAYQGEAPWPIQTLFHAVATDAYKTPLDLYQAKLGSGFVAARLGLTAVLTAGLFISWAAHGWQRLTTFFRSYRGYSLAAVAGILLGLDTSIRAVAPLAAVPLCILYLLYAGSRKKAVVYTLLLLTTSVAACLATWPYLWQDSIVRFLQSIATLSRFPWQGFILFNGQILTQGQQPWYYVPVLFALQITLPALILFILGLVSLRRLRLTSQERIEIGLLIATLTLPVLISLRPGTIVYNNGRQLLFTIPGLFLLAALGLEWVFRRLEATHWRLALTGIILLPGVVGIVRLHPYEYMYYNALAGIGGSTYTRFESDYWCTSYREAMAWVDSHAEPHATIAVGGSGIIGQTFEFARQDLHLVRLSEIGPSESPSMAVVCDGKGGTRSLLPGARTLMTVTREGAVLAEVKSIGSDH
jgi:hypothetical protein